MRSVCKPGLALCIVVLADLLSGAHASADDTPVQIGIEPAANVTGVAARYRLTQFLRSQGCNADIRPDLTAPDLALAFLTGIPDDSAAAPVLTAVNRDGHLPVPVWVTRRPAGVRSISELHGRDLATVAGRDPLGADLPLAALKNEGITPEPGQLYEAGDFSSALGLLLHNNTHAAVSELGFIQPFLTRNSLVVSWHGEPVKAAGWYRQAGWERVAKACEQALARTQRADDPQMFRIFPEWVYGFAVPDSQYSEDVTQ
jgi:hypothetical protein